MNNSAYNGWTNYETWVVNLWMDNQEGTYDYWREVAEDVYNNEAEEQKHFTKMEDAVGILADRLKNDHEDKKDDILESVELTSSVWADLLGAALSEVNWREIAEHLLENVEVDA
jgi:hypothetical protein